jgi:hypothetical protein
MIKEIGMRKEGYYWLLREGESPCLVYYYKNTDTGEMGYGFNIVDGAGFLPEKDLTADTVVVKAKVIVDEPGKKSYEIRKF